MFSFTCSIVSDKPSAARKLSSLTALLESNLLPNITIGILRLFSFFNSS